MPENVRHFFTKVAGVSHKNDSGTKRQKIIAKCSPGEQLELITDPENPHDKNAVKVCRQNGQQIGYLTAHVAGEIASKIRNGWCLVVLIAEITGGTKGKSTQGVNLVIIQGTPKATAPEIKKYAKQILKTEIRQSTGGGGCLSVILLFVILFSVAFAATLYSVLHQ